MKITMKYVDGAGGADGRIFSTLMGRVEAIWSINPLAMEELVYKYIYKRNITQGLRDVVNVLIMLQAKRLEHATAEKLNEVVRDANECSRPSARNLIKRAVALKLITEDKDGRNVFYFLSSDQEHRARKVISLKPIVWKVVAIQADSPLDKTAGSGLLPRECYYNVIAYFPS
jgi:hypothetical protein